MAQALLAQRSDTLGVDLAIWDVEGRLIAATGPAWPGLPAEGERALRRRADGPPSLQVRLDDGRWFGMRPRHSSGAHTGFLVSLLLVALLVALGAYPLARRLTRRLETVRSGVEKLGSGALDTRVIVQGRDEVAALATSFNAAAERIEGLVDRERLLLAHASHELRSPLARLRVALQLLREGAAEDPERRLDEAERDIVELDSLVEDLLLGSRLEAQRGAGVDPWVDVAALVTEECDRVGVAWVADPAELRGDAPALRRALRNLIENAQRHGGGDPEVELRASAEELRIAVLDRGPGIPEAERGRAFDPFVRLDPEASTGAGLGLYLVRQVARYHGGDASIEDREGGGTCVLLRLPRAEATLR